jgi:kumamolisin
MARHVLQGSERAPVAGANAVGKADPNERLEVSIILRRPQADAFNDRMKGMAPGAAVPHLEREKFAAQFGAQPSDVAAVKTFAEQHGLAVVQEDPARRTVVLAGTVAKFNEAFSVDLQNFEHPGGSYRGRTGAIQLPDELHGIVEAVLGLDNRPQASTHFRKHAPDGNVHWNAGVTPTSFTPRQLASLYNFPQGRGQGECIAIVELGGGYRPADLKTYFSALNIPNPNVSAVSVDHGKNHPTGDANGPDGEVMLDVEVAGAIAPAAKIVVYFAPNTDAGFLDAITTAIHDTKNKPSVVSISWGGPESAWTPQAMKAFDQAFQDAATLGVTICAASGDSGSSDGVTDHHDHVDFPASSPFVLACGGTQLQSANGAISRETVWNDGPRGGAGGGGESSFFPVPTWQSQLQVTTARGKAALQHRGVPDVAGDADPVSGYDVRVDGQDTVIGGTSAVAPLWAGLLAVINAARGKPVGYINPLLYQHSSALHDITQGNNGTFVAAAGWDACTGLGTPDGQAIARALAAPAVA